MKKLGLGIIGLGGIAEKLLPTFLKHPRTDIKGGFDVDVKRMAAMKKKFDIVTVTDLEELINDKSVDIIYLAVPPRHHHDIAIKVMRAGKHILCEKPLAGTLEEAIEMYEVAIETQIVHAMNFPLYYGFQYNRIKQLLEANTLGSLKRIELSALYPALRIAIVGTRFFIFLFSSYSYNPHEKEVLEVGFYCIFYHILFWLVDI